MRQLLFRQEDLLRHSAKHTRACFKLEKTVRSDTASLVGIYIGTIPIVTSAMPLSDPAIMHACCRIIAQELA